MKIIKRGNKTIECKKCGCVMEYDCKDIKMETKDIIKGSIFRTIESWSVEVIICPQCNKKIEVGRKCLK